MHHLALLLCMVVSSLGAALPSRSSRGISSTLLTNLTLLSQYSAASSCIANSNASAPGSPIFCDAGYCSLVNQADTEILYAFSGINLGDTAGYIAADHTHHLLLVSFRNTETRANLFTDFNIAQVDASAACPACRAHMGFWIAAAAAKKHLLSSITDARAKYPGYTLVITGHSLGGAIATLHAVFWRGEGVETDLYTFGAPSVGNYAFAAFISDDWRGLGANYRVTHLDDIVPKVLYRMSREPGLGLLMPEYSQSSPEYWITADTGDAVTGSDVSVVRGVGNEEGNLGARRGKLRDHMWYFESIDVCSNDG